MTNRVVRGAAAPDSHGPADRFDIPAKMRAVVIREHGGPEVLNIEEVPTPAPAFGEVLLAVEAVGLNHLDIFARQGLKGPAIRSKPLPHVSGVDVAGRVVALGEGVEGFDIGAPVLLNPGIGCGTCAACRRGFMSMCRSYAIIGEDRWGGLADYVTVPARAIIPRPEDLPAEIAAAVPVAYTTAWHAVVRVAQVQAGQRVLVIGASGGVGSAALMISRLSGARVAAVAGSAAKRERALALGAEVAFDSYGDWLSGVLEWTDGEGVDATFDAVGAPTWRSSIQSLGMGGCLVISGATGGDTPDISIREIYQSHRRILGAPIGSWQSFVDVAQLVFDGTLKPEVYGVYPLEQIAEAQRVIEDREHFGKVVIKVS